MSKAKRPKFDDSAALEAISIDTDDETIELDSNGSSNTQRQKEERDQQSDTQNQAMVPETIHERVQHENESESKHVSIYDPTHDQNHDASQNEDKNAQNGAKPDGQHDDQYDEQAAKNVSSTDAFTENESRITLATLLPDCLDEIFNFLPSADIKSVGATCKELHKVTADHFKLKYPAKKMKIRMPLSYFKPSTTNGFGPYYRNVFIEDADIQIFTLLAEICENPMANPLNKIQFGQKTHRKKISTGFGARIRDQLKTVASIEFLGCKIDGDVYQLILQFTEKLRRLSIRNYAHEGMHIGINDDWLRKKYRTLEHLALVKNPTKIEQLKPFFEKNRHIKSFTTTMSIVWLNKTVFQSSVIDLHELNIELSLDEKSHLKLFVGFLNKLHRLGRFKNLKLRLVDASILTQNVDGIASLNGLNGIYFDCDVIINDEFTTALASLDKLTTIYIRQPIEAEPTSKGNLFHGIANIETIYIQTIKADLFDDQILPIVRQSPKICKIFIRKVTGDLDLKMIKINDTRIKLRDVIKVKVFLDDDTFLKIKWKYVNIELPAIEVKRAESDLTNHPFALHDE
ncbi:uncharacterized protein LOC129573180 [Sitodiplosis mosellana]|uniref:uncharacterized protein LOC129573180 n=1 Tax=Sitodiplosis mosellana TaxID=263140 RepID=UPI0024439D44|nr:uncharacterized protein LOC129573180 [Sitodiplosis mosellana]